MTTLRRHYRGERVVVLANRAPFTDGRDADGRVTIRRAPGGLVTALEPIVRSCAGVWVAPGSQSSQHLGYRVHGVAINDRERRGYYEGFSNEALWPLCHRTSVKPVFRVGDFELYRAVNLRFSAAVCGAADTPAPLVLVQDYHCALAPRAIRMRRPNATIVTFWHIPWPDPDRFAECPWVGQLLDGLLGSTIVGFQTREDSENFLETVASRAHLCVDFRQRMITANDRRTSVRDYPISIEWPPAGITGEHESAASRRDLCRELGVPLDSILIVGVDRLDYTKGIEEKFFAIERLLEELPELRSRVVLAQLLQPSRECLPAYRELRCRVLGTAARVNARFKACGHNVIAIIEGHHETADVFRYLRAADVGYVGSLHDGMNLVAKEFVAARDDERGVLVLSRYAGAARELSGAVIVDPYDIGGTARALATALRMPPAAQSDRMRAMRSYVRTCNVFKWATDLLRDAAQMCRPDPIGCRARQSAAAAQLPA
jgi:trehalose 6-phosphate synthase